MTGLPKKIDISIIFPFSSGMILTEFDGKPAGSIEPKDPAGQALIANPGIAMLGAEAVLAALGYQLNRDTFYIGRGLIIGHFHQEKDYG